MTKNPLIAPGALSSLGDFGLLDVRAPEAYDALHAAGAVRLPIETWEAAAKRADTTFANTAYWEGAIGDLGLPTGLPVVVYDDGRMTEAARVWFILQYFGVGARLLNGGWPELARHRDAPPARTASPGNARFRAHVGIGPVGLVVRESLKARLGTQTQILDTRTLAEFKGEDLRRNARGGHLPGALALPHADLLNEAALRPPEALRRILAAAGFGPERPIVTHCDGGGRAALAAAAALAAGYDDIRVYYLSFSDWAKDDSCAVVLD